jgi:hypothetical protein
MSRSPNIQGAYMPIARIVLSGLAAASILSPMAALAQDQSEDSKPELHNTNDMQRALIDCLKALQAPECHLGVRLSLRLTFNARGAFEGRPRFTYVEPYLPSREKYEDVVIKTLERCMPLNFSSSFGSGVAGTPILLRLIRNPSC